jgi:branched-chain amino acid aminotransferase
MLKDRIIFQNGEFIPWEKATVHIMTHSFSRGSAIFEVLSLHNTDRGPAVFRLDEHMDRLFGSAELLNMTFAVDRDRIFEGVLETVRQNHLSQGFIKIVGFYPQIALDIDPPKGPIDTAIFALDPAQEFSGLDMLSPEAKTACISRWRKLDPQTVPIEAKASANYLNGMMASLEAQHRDFDMVLLLDTQGFVAEGPTESVFMVQDGALLTPPLGSVLQSITRKSLIKVAHVIGIPCREERFGPEKLMQADEIFFSGTPMKIIPIKQLEDIFLKDAPGPLARQCSQIMSDIVAGKDDRFKDWLFHI